MDSLPPDLHSALPDLTICDREPIHTPGHMQPHGVLVATVPGGLRISHVSRIAYKALGLQPESLLGTNLVNLVGAAGLAAMEQALQVAWKWKANAGRCFPLRIRFIPRSDTVY